MSISKVVLGITNTNIISIKVETGEQLPIATDISYIYWRYFMDDYKLQIRYGWIPFFLASLPHIEHIPQAVYSSHTGRYTSTLNLLATSALVDTYMLHSSNCQVSICLFCQRYVDHLQLKCRYAEVGCTKQWRIKQ